MFIRSMFFHKYTCVLYTFYDLIWAIEGSSGMEIFIKTATMKSFSCDIVVCLHKWEVTNMLMIT